MDKLAFSSSDSEFETPKSSILKKNSLPTEIEANSKPKRTIKVKKVFSPTVGQVKSKKTTKVTSASKVKVISIPKKVQKKEVANASKVTTVSMPKKGLKKEEKGTVSNEDCDAIINKYRNRLLEQTSDESNSNTELSLNLKQKSTKSQIKLQPTSKTAFCDLNRHDKKTKMMQWLSIPSIAINNSLKQEYFIKVTDFKDIPESFVMINDNDLSLLENHFSNQAYEDLNEKIKTKRDLKWTCSKCNEGEEKDSSVLCDACLKWYHYKCVGIDKAPKGDWFCVEKNCN